ncbi:FHA domain-containing protein [Megamonas funiformis]|uniref:FHA domain-containing protein n=1 Tax=Megamonas funiformis TaxID=437897 RepID=UPI00388DD8E0
MEGPDKDSYLAFGCNQIHLGRRDKNEFLLTDVNVSRLHAYITFEHGRHILRDANSLNGTSVNDRPITNFCLCPGDIIQIGNTRIVYDLI